MTLWHSRVCIYDGEINKYNSKFWKMNGNEFNFSRVSSHKPTVFINKVHNQWPILEFLLTFQEKNIKYNFFKNEFTPNKGEQPLQVK